MYRSKASLQRIVPFQPPREQDKDDSGKSEYVLGSGKESLERPWLWRPTFLH